MAINVVERKINCADPLRLLVAYGRACTCVFYIRVCAYEDERACERARARVTLVV